MKIGYQMKQVRERLAKGLVDKGVLRTEKRNFLLFDMATHPVADTATKDAVIKRILVLLTSQSPTVHPGIFYREEKKQIVLRMTRTLCLLCCAFAANVLENTLTHLSYEAREAAFQKADDILNEFSQWPMAPKTPGGGVGASLSGSNMGSTTKGTGIGEGSVLTDDPTEANLGVGVTELARTIKSEFAQSAEGQFEAIAAVLSVLSTMDSLVGWLCFPLAIKASTLTELAPLSILTALICSHLHLGRQDHTSHSTMYHQQQQLHAAKDRRCSN